MALPVIFTFNPLRTFIEIVEPDQYGYGRIAVSILDPEAPVPLMWYQTGDVGRLLDAIAAGDIARRHGVTLPGGLPRKLVALQGRH